MADIQYIPYGTEEVDYNQFLQNSANQVQDYVNQQPWSEKRKKSFISAYQEIMTKGITGASNDSGVWRINHNGDQIDLSSKSKIDKEMYGEAAYFIQQQMNNAKRKIEEKAEETKSKLPVFNNDLFTSGFTTHISNKEFGGQKWRTQEDWNILDERGENGLRGTSKRATKLADLLDSYSESLKDDQYNFEGSPFANLDDFKSKLAIASNALRNGTPEEQKEALNKIGLRYDDYLYNGGDDSFKKDNYEGTYNDYYGRYLPELQEQESKQKQEKLKQEAAKVEANKFKRFRFITGTGKSVEELSKYPDLIGQLNRYNTGSALTPEQKSELIGAFQIAAQTGQLQNVSKEELQKFGQGYINTPNRLKKISGLEGFYWDTIGNRVIQPFNDVTSPQSFQDIINQNSPEYKQKQYLNQEGAEYAELGAIAADIASIIDPEPFSAMGLSLGAAGARNYAKLQQPGKWSLGDYGGQALDYLTSVIGAVPVIGDAVLAAKVIKGLRKLSRLGAWMDTVNTFPALKTIWEKKINGNESLTVEDWRTIGTALRGIISHGRLNQSNLAARKVMEQRGIQVNPENVKGIKANINKWAQKTGFTKTEPVQKASSQTTIRIKDENGEIVEVPVTEKVKQDLETSFKGKSNAEKLKIVKENTDVQNSAKGKIDLTKATGLGSERSALNIKGVRNYTGGSNKGIFNETVSYTPSERLQDNFENYLKTRSTWSKIGLGSNSYLRRIDNQLKINPNQIIPSSKQNNETTKPQLSLPNKQPKVPDSPIKKDIDVSPFLNIKENIKVPYGKKDLEEVNRSLKEIRNFRQSYGLDKNNVGSIIGGYGQSGSTLKSGKIEVEIDGKKFTFKVSKSDLKNLNEGKISNIRGNIARQVEQLSKKADVNKTAKILKQLKAKGWLRQGGTINKQKINRYKELIK